MSDADFNYDDDDFSDDGGDFVEFSGSGGDEENEYFDDESFDPPPLERRNSYSIFSEDEIMIKTKTEINEIMEVLNIPSQALAVILLRQFRWNKEKLIGRFSEDPIDVATKCGMRLDMKLEDLPKNPKKKFTCSVCFEPARQSKSFALGCGHRFCNTCWKSYLQIAIKDGIECLNAKCLESTCKDIVHEEAFKKLVPKNYYEKYKRFLLRSYVEDNDMVKWCPSPDCNNCVISDRRSRKEPVTCKCGFSFCFQCADFEVGDHSPANCQIVDKWRKKSKDESENVNWLIANTKKCPKCRAPIEKNGGCMHMVCRKNCGGCGFEFCWLCRGNWAEHGTHTGGYYNCNKYDASDAKKKDQSAADVRTELELYIFYYHRYESHLSAGKIAKSQRITAEQRANELQKIFEIRSEDTRFLTEATEQLLRNRRVLQYSYVMGYYLNKSNSKEKALFEFLQEDLEKYTNRLSELYETNALNYEYQEFLNWKSNVTDFTRMCNNFLIKFVEGVSQGLTTVDEV